MAPQVEGYGQAADIWSFGITLLEVATGRAPTARRSVEEILISVLSSPEDDPSSIAGELSHTPEVGHCVQYVQSLGFRATTHVQRSICGIQMLQSRREERPSSTAGKLRQTSEVG